MAKLFGYRPTNISFAVGTEYPSRDYIIPRATSALFGTFCVPLFYLICRELSLSREASVVGVLLPLFDIMLTTQSRYILIDSQLLFYIALTLLCALRLFRVSELLGDSR